MVILFHDFFKEWRKACIFMLFKTISHALKKLHSEIDNHNKKNSNIFAFEMLLKELITDQKRIKTWMLRY